MVSAWMRTQSNKQIRNYKNYNSYTVPFPKYEFQIDLMDVTSLLRDVGSEIKSQLRYGLVCIDIFSKKCHIVPIENKDGDDVYPPTPAASRGSESEEALLATRGEKRKFAGSVLRALFGCGGGAVLGQTAS
jgi:hypothetical protein